MNSWSLSKCLLYYVTVHIYFINVTDSVDVFQVSAHDEFHPTDILRVSLADTHYYLLLYLVAGGGGN